MQNKPAKLNKYKDKLATFMSVLLKGGAWVENDYMSPQEIALQKLAEQKKIKIDKIKALEEECFSNEFAIWEAKLTKKEIEEIEKMIPDTVKRVPLPQKLRKELTLKDFFRNHVWHNKISEELKKMKQELE